MINFKDFRFETCSLLLATLKNKGYNFLTYESFIIQNPKGKVVVMRHDVDYKPENAVKMAQLEKDMGISASYFFGFINDSYSEKAIKKVISLGHELGYHYNDLVSSRGNFQLAIESFSKNLQKLRDFYPIKTMCMHGSPLSIWDNRLLWAKYDFTLNGIISEPYLNLDFDEILYLTDSSRNWNDIKHTIRDKVSTKFRFDIRNTFSIINLLERNELPNKIMINMHPHNWAASNIEWGKVLILQGLKNQIKRLINKISN